MPLRFPPLCALLATAVLASACGAGDDWSAARDAQPAPVGTLGPGFVDPDNPPAPEAAITPRPGSWDGVRPSPGYRVVLLTAGDDAPTRTLAAAVTKWAEHEDVSLKTLTAADPHQHVPRIVDAMALKPDLIITAGDDLIEALALVTASHLDQHFLIIGAQIPEPTYNVTAANWPGTSSSFTHERATRAIRAGVAAVLHGITGIVIQLH